MINEPRGLLESVIQNLDEVNKKEQILKDSINKALTPYDIVTDENGCVGFIQEVSINESQPDCHRSYAVNWVVQGTMPNNKHAWFDQSELTVHGNVFVEIAKSSCCPMGRNENYVERLIKGN